MTFRQAAALTGLGLAQMLLSVGMIVAGTMSIAACEQLFHTSWAVITGGCLFLVGFANASSCRCTPRMLLGLAIINLLMIGVAVAAIASGGIGVRCELIGGKNHKYADASCYSFAQQIHCVNKRWMTDDSIGAPTTTSTTAEEAFESNRTKGMIISGVVLGTGVILLSLCIAAATVSILARQASHTDLPPPHTIIQSAQDYTESVDTERRIDSQDAAEKANVLRRMAINRIIHNANTVKESTTVKRDELETGRRGDAIGEDSSRIFSRDSPSYSRVQMSYSTGSSLLSSDRSSSSSKTASRGSPPSIPWRGR
uniref:Uncharacterized protein n=2 Tax=Plectus sambesii TaxID=2011161 RepID=A0A914W053_9BILA